MVAFTTWSTGTSTTAGATKTRSRSDQCTPQQYRAGGYPKRRGAPWLTGPLLDEREQLEHRQVHRDHDRPNHDAYADHQDRLDDGRERLDARVDLVLVEVGDLAEHSVELARLLADLHHLPDHRREDRVLLQRLADRHTLVDARADPCERLLDDPVARRRAREPERPDAFGA